jgi:hypothetical protein
MVIEDNKEEGEGKGRTRSQGWEDGSVILMQVA